MGFKNLVETLCNKMEIYKCNNFLVIIVAIKQVLKGTSVHDSLNGYIITIYQRWEKDNSSVGKFILNYKE